MFVFEDIDQVSNNYHTERGLIIIAKSKESANQIITNEEHHGIRISEDEWDKCIVYELNPDKSYIEKVIAFPNAG